MAAAPTFLSIAGSDPSGGAGLQADLRTAAAHGLFGCGVVTAVTVQNRRGVLRSEPVDADLVAAQFAAILEDGSLAAIKTGMLATAAIVRVVGDLLATTQAPLVVDPVFTSSSGAVLLEGDLVSLYREHLFGHATLVTPNYDEAAAFLGCAPEDVAQAPEHAAAELGRDVPTSSRGATRPDDRSTFSLGGDASRLSKGLGSMRSRAMGPGVCSAHRSLRRWRWASTSPPPSVMAKRVSLRDCEGPTDSGFTFGGPLLSDLPVATRSPPVWSGITLVL